VRLLLQQVQNTGDPVTIGMLISASPFSSPQQDILTKKTKFIVKLLQWFIPTRPDYLLIKLQILYFRNIIHMWYIANNVFLSVFAAKQAER
jgi:hypothetical protein